jgi:hypothetical protein
VKTRPAVALLVTLLSSAVGAFVAATPAVTPARQQSGDAWGLVAGRRPTSPRRVARAARPAVPGARVAAPTGPTAATAGVPTRSETPAGVAGLFLGDDAWHRAGPEMAGTYLPDIVTQGNARVRRWSERTASPIRVWIAPGDTVPGWRPAFATTMRRAFSTWEQVGLGVRFTFVDAAGDADVRVTWTDSLESRRAGVTHWTADQDGWVTGVHIVLATWASDGRPATDASMRRIALHEIGHLLGLEHSADPADVMAAWVHAADLTDRDRRTARLLYALPPGEVADAGRLAPPAGAAQR